MCGRLEQSPKAVVRTEPESRAQSEDVAVVAKVSRNGAVHSVDQQEQVQLTRA